MLWRNIRIVIRLLVQRPLKVGGISHLWCLGCVSNPSSLVSAGVG